METTQLIIDRILNDRYDFCCLCFNDIAEADNLYNFNDEIIFDAKNTKRLFEILSCVVGNEVINNLADCNTVCHKCTESAVQSYKFIMDCRKSTLQLALAINTLYYYFESINGKVNNYNSLLVCLDSDYNVEHYGIHDKVGDKPSDVLYMLEKTPLIDQHVESDDFPKELNKENVIKQCKDTVKLIDIIYDKNNLSLFKCKICLSIFSRAPNLKKHYNSVHAPKNYKCSLCQKSFGTAGLLKSHQKHRHSAGVCCKECGKVFSCVYACSSHEKRHKIRHICQHCGKVYKTKHAFQTHVEEYHYGALREKPIFICNYCGKKYSQKSGLRAHIQLQHGNGKFHECDWCKKKFRSVSRLNEHIITHTKDKRFSCTECGSRFTTKMSLLYHTRRHTGERPYQCPHCDNSFVSASLRMTHIKQHHMPATLECDICHKKFKIQSYLLRHRNKHFDPKSKLHYSVKQ